MIKAKNLNQIKQKKPFDILYPTLLPSYLFSLLHIPNKIKPNKIKALIQAGQRYCRRYLPRMDRDAIACLFNKDTLTPGLNLCSCDTQFRKGQAVVSGAALAMMVF